MIRNNADHSGTVELNSTSSKNLWAALVSIFHSDFFLGESANAHDRFSTKTVVKVKSLTNIKSHPPQLCASSPARLQSPNPPPPPAGFRQWGRGLPGPERNACWCHASCKPSNPWIMNSGLQTISASPVHCVFTLDRGRACLQGSPYIPRRATVHGT